MILGCNLHRRHQSEGQRTMMVALIYPNAKNVGRAGNGGVIQPFLLDKGRLSKARAVIRDAAEMVPAVLAGTVSIEDAHRQCRERDNHRTTEAERERAELEGRKQRLDQLHSTDLDLAERVAQDTMSLDGAETEVAKRRGDDRRHRAGHYNVLDSMLQWGVAMQSPATISEMVAVLGQFGPSERPDLLGELRTLEVLAAGLAQLINEFPSTGTNQP